MPSGGVNPVGERKNQSFQLSFNRFLRVGFQGSRVTSNGGLILVRELDERLGFGELIQQHLADPRGKNTRLPLADLLRQSVYSRLAGYEDVNDAEQLSRDPTFRLIGSEKNWDRGAALPSRLQTFETELLAEEENFAGLARLNRELIGRAEAIDSPHRVVLDMDSTEIPVYGEQEQSAYNGHFESTCYHPVLLFNGGGDCLAAKLRAGNVHSAEGWEEFLLPEIERQQLMGKEVAFRADAAFAKPEIYEALEERGVKYAIRIPANENLHRDIEELLTGISFLAHPTREYTSVGLQLSPSRQIFSPRYCQRLPAALSESPKPIASASRTSFCRHLSMPGGYRNHFLGCAAGWAIPTEATAHLFAPAC